LGIGPFGRQLPSPDLRDRALQSQKQRQRRPAKAGRYKFKTQIKRNVKGKVKSNVEDARLRSKSRRLLQIQW
jgi:hypothetical protein